jgi:hypothetical protein
VKDLIDGKFTPDMQKIIPAHHRKPVLSGTELRHQTIFMGKLIIYSLKIIYFAKKFLDKSHPDIICIYA